MEGEGKRKREIQRKEGSKCDPVFSFCKRVCSDWGYSCVLWEKGLMNIGAFPVHAEALFSPLLSCPRGRHNFRFITARSCRQRCSHVINVLDSIRRWCFCFCDVLGTVTHELQPYSCILFLLDVALTVLVVRTTFETFSPCRITAASPIIVPKCVGDLCIQTISLSLYERELLGELDTDGGIISN